MAILSNLKPNKGARHSDRRRGRGDGSGLGGTAGKGHKGQKARTGGRVRRGFEGGQMPLHRRMPKVGFNNIFRVEFDIVNLAQLENLSGEVTVESLKKSGFVSGNRPVKVLGGGKLTKKLNVTVNGFTNSAKAKIEANGGKAEVIK